MTKREKVLEILSRRDGRSSSVLCPGGMMSLAVEEIMSASGCRWPHAHEDSGAMSRLAIAMQDAAGLDNIAMPFCMTVEAECYGARVDLGGPLEQPRARGNILPSDGTGILNAADFSRGRGAVLLDAIGLARASRPDALIIGNVVGPFSLLGMLADPLMLLRWTRRKGDVVGTYLDRITDDLILFSRLQIAAGADAICVAEPTATGEILGGKLFGKLVAPRLKRLAAGIVSAGAPAMLHICGDAAAIEGELAALPFNCVSFDSMVDIIAVAAHRPQWLVMGNVSPFLLENGPPDAIARVVRALVGGGVRLVAPGCGVVPTTPMSHIRAMKAAAVRDVEPST